MSSQEVITLSISFVALGISVYGIFERRMAAYSALRVRFSELVTTVARFQVEEEGDPISEPTQTPSERWARLGASLSGRRALVSYQALALENDLHRLQRWPFGGSYRLTTDEYAVLAVSLGQLRDWAAAEQQWRLAVDASDRTTPVSCAAAHNGYANCLFECGRFDDGRHQYQLAVDTFPQSWDKFLVYYSWLVWERRCGGDSTVPRREAERLSSEPSPWQPWAKAKLNDAVAVAGNMDGVPAELQLPQVPAGAKA
jgi:hypothetical protein